MSYKFPKAYNKYREMKSFLMENLKCEPPHKTVEEICEILEGCGFKPIPIGGHYHYDINFMNAIAFKNNKGKITYITNSTNKSCPELKYLEELFEKDLREKAPQISDTYYISGGSRTNNERMNDSLALIYEHGFPERNVIMDILANRNGGIHCMTAEIPKF